MIKPKGTNQQINDILHDREHAVTSVRGEGGILSLLVREMWFSMRMTPTMLEKLLHTAVMKAKQQGGDSSEE